MTKAEDDGGVVSCCQCTRLETNTGDRDVVIVGGGERSRQAVRPNSYDALREDEQELEGLLSPKDVGGCFYGRGLTRDSGCCGGCCSCRRCCCGCLLALVLLVAVMVPCGLMTPESQVSQELIRSELGGSSVYSWQNLTRQKWRELVQDVQHTRVSSQTIQGERGNLTFSSDTGAKIADLMYKATSITSLKDVVPQSLRVPPKLRGVFWMRGNPSGNVLVVLQNGVWFQDEQTYLTPVTPYSLAWASRAPKKARFWGLLHNSMKHVFAMLGDGLPTLTWSYVVKPCPAGRVCPADSQDGTFATLQLHRRGNLHEDSTNAYSLAPGLPRFFSRVTAKFEMEEQVYSPQPGSLWRRPCWWGIGVCRVLEIGSYDLVKILDADGAPLQPGYNEFIEYLGDVPLFVWSGNA